jgi:hypothetical protein
MPVLVGGQVRRRRFKFGLVAEGVSVSDGGMAATRCGGECAYRWRGALAEEVVDTSGRAYAEWVIEEADAGCNIVLGVTAARMEAAPSSLSGDPLHTNPESRMCYCHDSRAWPGNRDWGASGQRRRWDRVGLLVDGGQLWVYVNGVRLGPGPMASDLPAKVHFAIEMYYAGTSVRLVTGAAPPAEG